MAKKKWKWWLVLIPIVMAAVILAVLFWDSILIRIAPKAVLTAAFNKAFVQLEERFQDDPLLIPIRSMDPEGKFTAAVKFDTENDILGPVSYDLTVQTDRNSHQVFAEGTAAASEQNLDFSLYMDADFMAVSSDDLVKGIYYGITYDTFASDLRSIPLLNYVVSDRLLASWNDSVQNIQAQMARDDYALPRISEFSYENVQKLMLGILTTPCEIEKCSVSLPDGRSVDFHKLNYSVSAEQVNEFLSELTGSQYSSDMSATVSFYLYHNSIVKIALTCLDQECILTCILTLGENPAEETLRLSINQSENGQQNETVITVATQYHDAHYVETWNFYRTADEESQKSIEFDWETVSGAMILRDNISQDSVALNLCETENGFQLETDDLTRLLQMIAQNNQETSDSKQVSCIMSVSKGAEISTPAYKNMDQWSMEDFFVLLGGIGSLFGIKIK